METSIRTASELPAQCPGAARRGACSHQAGLDVQWRRGRSRCGGSQPAGRPGAAQLTDASRPACTGHPAAAALGLGVACGGTASAVVPAAARPARSRLRVPAVQPRRSVRRSWPSGRREAVADTAAPTQINGQQVQRCWRAPARHSMSLARVDCTGQQRVCSQHSGVMRMQTFDGLTHPLLLVPGRTVSLTPRPRRASTTGVRVALKGSAGGLKRFLRISTSRDFCCVVVVRRQKCTRQFKDA
jgi:hypothetical protein